MGVDMLLTFLFKESPNLHPAQLLLAGVTSILQFRLILGRNELVIPLKRRN